MAAWPHSIPKPFFSVTTRTIVTHQVLSLQRRPDISRRAFEMSPLGGAASTSRPAARGRVPDFFIVGNSKSGTTALYLWSQSAARRIAQARPDARIIAILREPASFLRSLHLQFLQTYVETESDLRKAIGLEEARREGRNIPRYTYWPQALLYSEHVR